MPRFCSTHHPPVGGAAHVDGPLTALTFVWSAMNGDAEPMTIALLLDERRRVLSMLRVDNTVDADHVLGVAESIVDRAAQHGRFRAVVIASVRPEGVEQLDDVERWLELDDAFADAGLDLVEWFVVGRSTSCPRELLGEPARW